MRRQRIRRYSELTSLIDVLFILLFATLVQQNEVAASADAPPEPEPPGPDAGVPDAAPDPQAPADPHVSARAVRDQLDMDEVILVSISDDGMVTSIERETRRIPLAMPLLVPTGDGRVVSYAGADRPDLRLCRVVADALGAPRLDRALLLVTTARPLRELGYALVHGLRQDTSRCLDDAGAYALIIRAL